MQTEIEFLEKHRNADNIVVRADDGTPIRAEYTWDHIHGGKREYPAVYYYPEY